MEWIKRLFRRISLAERVAADIADTERELYGAKRRALLEDWHVRYYTERLADLRRDQAALQVTHFPKLEVDYD